MKRMFAVVVTLLLAAMPLVASAETVVVTPGDVSESPGAWHPANQRSDGSSVITTAKSDSHGGAGSLEQTLPATGSPSPKTDFQIYSTDTTVTEGEGLQAETGFGLLSDLSTLSFEWYRDAASTAAGHLTPAFRVIVWDPEAGTNGSSYLLIWEGVYNNYPAAAGAVPVDQWVTEDIVAGNFWRVPQYVDGVWNGISACNTGPNTCYYFDRGLADWGFSASTVVIGLEVGLGSGWNGSYHGFVDYVTLGFGDSATVWDFEVPTNNCVFDTAGTTMTLMADCWTTQTIKVPDGYTLNGNGHTITAVDPEGGHFLGAVVQNAGASMNVQNLTVTADALANVCDNDPNWLVGILLKNASGKVVNNQVVGINQGASGCQEGSGILVANVDEGTTFPNYTTDAVGMVAVEIARNVVDDYQKRGVAVFGDVNASIHHNRVGDSATQANLAANSVHLDFGATGVVSYNTIYGNQWLNDANSGSSALLLFETNNVTVRLNTINGASDYGIYITDDSTGARVQYNRVSDYGNPDGAYDSGILDYGNGSKLLLNIVCGFQTPAEYGENVKPSPIGVIGMPTCFDWFSQGRGR